MLVKEILNVKGGSLFTASSKTSVAEAMSLLIDNNISCLPVVNNENSLIGIISDKDIFRAVHKDPVNFGEIEVGKLMSTNVIVGLADDEVQYIAGMMTQNRIRHIPIVEEMKLIGLISVGDVVKTQLEDFRIENRYLKQYIDGNYPG